MSIADLTLRCLLETLPQSHDHHRPIASKNSDDVILHHQDCSSTEPPEAKRARTDPILQSLSSKLRGLVIALCCHHRCSWSQLAGTAWLRGRGFSPIDAHLVSKMTSWAVCGVRSPDLVSLPDDHHTDNHLSPEKKLGVTMATDSTQSRVAMTTSSTPYTPSYHPHPREEVGLKCKRVLDLARLQYLRERGMEARLVYFVSRSTSLENVLLIATPASC